MSLNEYLLSHQSDFVFINDETGKSFDYSQLIIRFRRDQKAAGMEGVVGLHLLRHIYASHYMMNGGSIYDLKKILGHKKIETTERYAHLAQDYLQEKARVVSFKKPTSAYPPNIENVVEMKQVGK